MVSTDARAAFSAGIMAARGLVISGVSVVSTGSACSARGVMVRSRRRLCSEAKISADALATLAIRSADLSRVQESHEPAISSATTAAASAPMTDFSSRFTENLFILVPQGEGGICSSPHAFLGRAHGLDELLDFALQLPAFARQELRGGEHLR